HLGDNYFTDDEATCTFDVSQGVSSIKYIRTN
ncbi:hypothetical protein SS7213T_03555, partial [Staphylococcus simiae CCM 7213 = CCUG 51256]